MQLQPWSIFPAQSFCAQNLTDRCLIIDALMSPHKSLLFLMSCAKILVVFKTLYSKERKNKKKKKQKVLCCCTLWPFLYVVTPCRRSFP